MGRGKLVFFIDMKVPDELRITQYYEDGDSVAQNIVEIAEKVNEIIEYLVEKEEEILGNPEDVNKTW